MKKVLFLFVSLLLFSCHSYSPDKNSQLIEAVKDGNIDRVRLLIAEGADINFQDKNGSTPLHWAAYYGRKEIAKLLLMQGASPYIKDKNGITPIDVARINRQEEILKIFSNGTDSR